MRQFLSWRYWATLASLCALTILLWTCQGSSDSNQIVVEANNRRIDLIAQTSTVRSDQAWSVSNGISNGDATAVLLDGRVLTIADGTMGNPLVYSQRHSTLALFWPTLWVTASSGFR